MRKRARSTQRTIVVDEKPMVKAKTWIPRELYFKSKSRTESGTKLWQVEKKYIDTSVGALVYPLSGTGTGTLTLLNGVVVGSTAITRVGREIVMKSIYINGAVNVSGTSSGTGFIRTILFYDNQSNATAPAITDLLVTDDPNAIGNLNNRKRFKVIRDRRDIIGGVGTGSGDPGTVIFDIFLKCNYPVEFNANVFGDIRDITKGSLYLYTATGGSIVTTQPSDTLNVRVRFTD